MHVLQVICSCGNRSPTNDDMVERPLCTCGTHAVWNRSRMSMLNDSHRNRIFFELLNKVCL